MRCRECGRDIDVKTKFCKYCGAPSNIPDFSTPVQEGPKCPKCGAKIKEGNTFCTQCGTRLSAGTANANNNAVSNNAGNAGNSASSPVNNNAGNAGNSANSPVNNGAGNAGNSASSPVNNNVGNSMNNVGSSPHSNVGGAANRNNANANSNVSANSNRNIRDNTYGKDDRANPYQEPKSGKLGKVILVITLIVIILLAVIALYYAKEKGYFDRDDAKETVQQSPAAATTKDEDQGNASEAEADSEENEEEEEEASPAPDVATDGEVEEQVLIIRTQYDDIVNKINADAYDKKTICTSGSVYMENNVVRAIVIPKNADANTYAKSFYYDENGSLIFSYYEADDASRLYFYNSQMIRWRYSPDASDAQNAENHDGEITSQYDNWQKTVLQDSEHYLGLANSAATTDDTAVQDTTANDKSNDYVWPGSDSKYMKKSDLKGFSKRKCLLARNELYARHGRKFSDKSLQKYFNKKSWYKGKIEPDDFKESMLNKYEIHNRDLIVAYEKKKGYR